MKGASINSPSPGGRGLRGGGRKRKSLSDLIIFA